MTFVDIDGSLVQVQCSAFKSDSSGNAKLYTMKIDRDTLKKGLGLGCCILNVILILRLLKFADFGAAPK